MQYQNQSCKSRTMCTTIRPKTNLRIYLAAEVRAGIKSTILQTASDDICNDHANKPQEDGEDNRNNQIEPCDQGIILTPLPSLLSGDEDFSIQVSLNLTKRIGKYFEGVLSEPGFKPCYTRFWQLLISENGSCNLFRRTYILITWFIKPQAGQISISTFCESAVKVMRKEKKIKFVLFKRFLLPSFGPNWTILDFA